MRKLTILALAVALFAGVGSAQIFDFYGYTYESGGTLQLMGEVDGFFAPMPFIPGYEYTICMENLSLVSSTPMGGGWVQDVYTGGRFDVFEDATLDFSFGVNPPNATVPSTFIDGSLYLSGEFQTFESYTNAGIGIGSFQGDVVFTGGSALPAMGFSSGGWTFGGTTSNPIDLPAGYLETWDGMFYRSGSTGTERTSWGEVKSLFR